MILDDMIETLIRAKKMKLGNKGLIFNMDFENLKRFEFCSYEFEAIFEKARSWAREKGYTARGPDILEETGDFDYLGFVVFDPEGKYKEAFRLCRYNGGKGWGSLQFSSTERQRVLEIASELVGMHKVIDSASTAGVAAAKPLDTVHPLRLLEYFDQFEPMCNYFVDGISSRSGEVVRGLREKGWNLYQKVGRANMDLFSAFVMGGPVSKLEMDRNYLIVPAVKNAKSREEVWKAMILAHKMRIPEYLCIHGKLQSVNELSIGEYCATFFRSAPERIPRAVAFHLPYNELGGCIRKFERLPESMQP